MAAMDSSPPSTATAPRRGRRRTALTLVAALTLACSSTSVHAGLRGPQHATEEERRFPAARQSERRMPQHGNQMPRPRSSAMLPQYYDGRRQLLDEGRGERRLPREKGRDLERGGGGKTRGRPKKKPDRTKPDRNKPGRDKPNRDKDKPGRGGDKDKKDREEKAKIKAENDKRKEENRKKKNKNKQNQQGRKPKPKQQSGGRKPKPKQQSASGGRPKQSPGKNKPKRQDGKDKKDKDKDKKDKDKKDKDKKDKDKKDKDKKDKGKDKEKDKGKDKDKPQMMTNWGGNAKPNAKPGRDEPKPASKPASNNNNGGGKKPGKQGTANGKKPGQVQLKPGKNKGDTAFDPVMQYGSDMADEMTDGKLDLSGYVPPYSGNKPKPQPVNVGEASSFVDNGGDIVVNFEDEGWDGDEGFGTLSSPAAAPGDMGMVSSPTYGGKGTGGYTTGGKLKWNFENSLDDDSTLLDGFEGNSNLNWNEGTWELSSTYSYEGSKSTRSGIAGVNGVGTAYSNRTLTTDDDFPGGVLTFQIQADSLTLPMEAFFVTVDGQVALAPSATASSSSGEWVEYSVPVGGGDHKVTFVHVYNPFGMKSLPTNSGGGALYMDDLRLTPFTSDLSKVTMTNGGDAPWKTKGNSKVVASTNDFGANAKFGSSDITFALHSIGGGELMFNIQTATAAPTDDFAVVINGKPADAIFGEMLSFDHRTVEIPPGKATVTLQHRKNPGRLGQRILDGLGKVNVEGTTILEGLEFWGRSEVWYE